MALTSAQKAQIRMYMGWSARFHQTDSALEFALSAVDADADVETLITGILASIADVETKMLDADSRAKVEQVGTIRLQAEREVGIYRSKGRQFIGRMAVILGVDVRHDVFSGTTPQHRAGHGGILTPRGSGGSGNLPPIG